LKLIAFVGKDKGASSAPDHPLSDVRLSEPFAEETWFEICRVQRASTSGLRRADASCKPPASGQSVFFPGCPATRRISARVKKHLACLLLYADLTVHHTAISLRQAPEAAGSENAACSQLKSQYAGKSELGGIRAGMLAPR
jgi:hypothetical protein